MLACSSAGILLGLATMFLVSGLASGLHLTRLLLALTLAGISAALLLLAARASAKLNYLEKTVVDLASLMDRQAAAGALQLSAQMLDRLKGAISSLNLELMESRKRQQALIERAVDVICITDAESRLVSVNNACKSAWGYTPQELEKRPLQDILVSNDSASVLDTILGSSRSIDKIMFECKLRKKSGALIDVVWTGYWSASDHGLFCIVHDISERKQAEELVKRSEERLRLILEGLPAGVLIVNDSDTIEFANSEAARLLLFSSQELSGKSEASLLTDKHAIELTTNAGARADLQRTVARANRSDGSTIPVEIAQTRIELSDQQKSIAVFLDKTREQELEQMRREFVAMVTHDIRTPLASVSGILALLERGLLGQLTEQGCVTTRNLKSTCNRLVRLLNDLLDLERIQSGKFMLEASQTSLKCAIAAAVEDLLPPAADRNITFEVPDSDITCWADQDRLVQVLVNLLSNAIKYSPDSSSITVLCEDLGTTVKLSVVDKGRGIPADKISKIFNRFEQVEIADAKQKGGSGLGLAICQAIVQEHGGEIGVESTYGEGSCVWFTIPRQAQIVQPGNQPQNIGNTSDPGL
jgi:PAS domain S-box-containing protein